MESLFNLEQYGISPKIVIRNASPAKLYENAISFDKGAAISDQGALILQSGTKTGRSPKDKRIIEHPDSEDNIWWGDINIKMDNDFFSFGN